MVNEMDKDVSPTSRSITIRTVAVIGAGTMGSGIAQVSTILIFYRLDLNDESRIECTFLTLDSSIK